MAKTPNGTMENMVKISVDVEAPHHRVEKLSAMKVDDSSYMVCCVPVYCDLNYGDIVRAVENEYGELVFKELTKEYGYTKYCIIGKKENIATFSSKELVVEDVSNILGNNVYYCPVKKTDDKKELLAKIVKNKLYSPMLAREVITDIHEGIEDVRLAYHFRGARKLVKPGKAMEKYIFGTDKRD